jgi:DNA-3-methyladenine glycosylase I
MNRCDWVNIKNAAYVKYHDEEWGVPVHDDLKLFEMLILEGAQAGLSWETVLNKRATYRIAFDGFDPQIVSTYDADKIESLMQNPGIVRNRLKIKSAVQNAKVFLKLQKDHGSFDAYLWGFVGGKTIINAPTCLEEVPIKTALSDQISKALKKEGMNFVGSTIIYAYLQAVGVVDDHIKSCYKASK